MIWLKPIEWDNMMADGAASAGLGVVNDQWHRPATPQR